jgi:hypothetical protein
MHLVIATPMFGGLCHSGYMLSKDRLAQVIRQGGGRCSTLAIGNESLIERARNTLAWHFIANAKATHFLFWDGDQAVWTPNDILRMVAADKPIICAAVPMKKINWQAVACAARAGVPDDELERCSGIFNVDHEDEDGVVSVNEPFEIKRGGSGLMLIQRHVFDELSDGTPDYQSDLPGQTIPPGSRVKHFFPVGIADDRLMSEDYGFCNAWRSRGGKIWCAPWVEVEHYGTYAFRGTYKDCFAHG